MAKKILFAGESWMSYTTHVKGFDSFYTSTYEEGIEYIRNSIIKAGYEIDFIPNHLASTKFPFTMEELETYDCVVLSDIGSNTLLLPPQTFSKSVSMPNRCDLIKDYVEKGGSFLMIGGYLSFTGVDAKARFGQTSIKDILPVICLDGDDRSEHPEGIYPRSIDTNNSIMKSLPTDWPMFLGYNKTIPTEKGKVLATIGEDPFIAIGEFGKGRSAVFTSDCSPHWGSPEFVGWKYYDELWKNIFNYLCND